MTLDINSLAELYDTEITSFLDRLVLLRSVRCRRRASDAWFDDDCRFAKRSVRLFVRDIRRVRRQNSLDTAATAAWSDRCHDYRALLRRKSKTFWKAEVTSERSSPQLLWRSVDVPLGPGRSTAEAMRTFFDAKVMVISPLGGAVH